MARTKSKKTVYECRESIRDILNEMRECAASCTSHGCKEMESFADRIEATLTADICIGACDGERRFAGYGFIES